MTARKKLTTVATEDHPLSHLIPAQWFDEDYISRSFEGVNDLDVLKYARDTRQNTLMFGPTGPGKTSAVYAFAARYQIPVVNLACNGAIDPSTVFVRPTVAHDGSIELIESDVLAVMRMGGILYLDEVNFMPPRVASVLHGALDKRRTITVVEKGNEKIALHGDCQVIATYNPDYQGTKPLNEAFKNRFGIKLRFDYDREIESKLVEMIPSLIVVADQLRAAHTAGDVETPTSTNMLMEFEQIAYDIGQSTSDPDIGYRFALLNFLNAYHEDERTPVKKAIEAHSDAIRQEIAASLGTEIADDYVEEDDDMSDDNEDELEDEDDA